MFHSCCHAVDTFFFTTTPPSLRIPTLTAEGSRFTHTLSADATNSTLAARASSPRKSHITHEPLAGLAHVSVGLERTFTAYRLNQVSLLYVPLSPFFFRSAALHSSISSFTLGFYHRTSPPSSTRSLSRTLLQLIKFSLHFGHRSSSSSPRPQLPLLFRFIPPLFST